MYRTVSGSVLYTVVRPECSCEILANAAKILQQACIEDVED